MLFLLPDVKGVEEVGTQYASVAKGLGISQSQLTFETTIDVVVNLQPVHTGIIEGQYSVETAGFIGVEAKVEPEAIGSHVDKAVVIRWVPGRIRQVEHLAEATIWPCSVTRALGRKSESSPFEAETSTLGSALTARDSKLQKSSSTE